MQQSANGQSQAATGASESAMMGSSTDGMNHGMNSTDVTQRAVERSVPPVRAQATRIHHVTSDPVNRGSGHQTAVEAAKEPKFYGSIQRSLSDSGVRCGGFQRLDWPSTYPRPAVD